MTDYLELVSTDSLKLEQLSHRLAGIIPRKLFNFNIHWYT